MLIAMKHFGSVGIGVTAPQLFRANDRKFYVVKLQNNRLGPKVLVNEFLAAKLGEMLGLCFPVSSSIEIEEDIIWQSPKLQAAGTPIGQHFASQYLNHTEYVGKDNLHNAVNITEMAGILLFDSMFHNGDRTSNRKNLLLHKEKSGYKIYAIDNSHLFRTTRWTIALLNRISRIIQPYYRYSYALLLNDWLSPSHFFPYVRKVKEMSYESICEIVAQIPEEWLPDDSERQALINYVILRRDMVKNIEQALYKQIPKSRGGSKE